MAGIDNYPGLLPDRLIQGADRTFIIKIQRKSGNVAQPVDITGSTFTLTFGKDRDVNTVPSLLIQQTSLPEAIDGICTFQVDGTDLSSLTKGGYFYAIRWIPASGETKLLDLGRIYLAPNV